MASTLSPVWNQPIGSPGGFGTAALTNRGFTDQQIKILEKPNLTAAMLQNYDQGLNGVANGNSKYASASGGNVTGIAYNRAPVTDNAQTQFILGQDGWFNGGSSVADTSAAVNNINRVTGIAPGINSVSPTVDLPQVSAAKNKVLPGNPQKGGGAISPQVAPLGLSAQGKSLLGG